MKYLLFTMSAIIIAASCSNNITDHRNTVRIDWIFRSILTPQLAGQYLF